LSLRQTSLSSLGAFSRR
jgi:hypothetical protein